MLPLRIFNHQLHKQNIHISFISHPAWKNTLPSYYEIRPHAIFSRCFFLSSVTKKLTFIYYLFPISTRINHYLFYLLRNAAAPLFPSSITVTKQHANIVLFPSRLEEAITIYTYNEMRPHTKFLRYLFLFSIIVTKQHSNIILFPSQTSNGAAGGGREGGSSGGRTT